MRNTSVFFQNDISSDETTQNAVETSDVENTTLPASSASITSIEMSTETAKQSTKPAAGEGVTTQQPTSELITPGLPQGDDCSSTDGKCVKAERSIYKKIVPG